jgi:NitT/TauT family transport system permease protein
MNTAAPARRFEAGTRWQGAASLLAMIMAWQVAAEALGSRFLPDPVEVVRLTWSEAIGGELLSDLAVTFTRVAISLCLAMIVGSAIGYAAGCSRGLDRWLRPWLIVLLNVPALVSVILVYIWLGLTEAALVVAVALNKIPTVAVTIREGAGCLDRELAEMAALYRLPWSVRFTQLAAPQLLPYLVIAARNGLALTWKIVLVAELLGRSSGIGFQLQIFFQNFDVGRILAYTAAFTATVFAIEYMLLVPLEKSVSRWRR